MTTPTPGAASLAPHNVKKLAVSLLSIASQVEAAERAIRAAIIEAARAGNSAKVIEIVSRWQATPPVQLAQELLSPARAPRRKRRAS